MTILSGIVLSDILQQSTKNQSAIYLPAVLAIFLSCLLLLMIRSSYQTLTAYFSLQVNGHIGEAKIKGDGMSHLKHRFVFKVSDSYFNRDDEIIKVKIAKRNLIKNFMHDIKKDPEIPNTPARVKRYNRDVGGLAAGRQLTIKRMDSMHDIQNLPEDKVPNSASKLMSPNTMVKIRHKQSGNKSIIPSNTTSGIPSTMNMDVSGDQNIPNKRFKTRNSLSISIPMVRPFNTKNTIMSPLVTVSRQKFDEQVSSKVNDVLRKRKACSEICNICQENQANTVYEKCLHGGLCVECAISSFWSNDAKCIFCRQVDSIDLAHRPDF